MHLVLTTVHFVLTTVHLVLTTVHLVLTTARLGLTTVRLVLTTVHLVLTTVYLVLTTARLGQSLRAWGYRAGALRGLQAPAQAEARSAGAPQKKRRAPLRISPTQLLVRVVLRGRRAFPRVDLSRLLACAA